MAKKTKSHSALKGILIGLKSAQMAIGLLESKGIDVDRLVHISNGQGPHSKLLHSAIGGISDILADAASADSAGLDDGDIVEWDESRLDAEHRRLNKSPSGRKRLSSKKTSSKS